MKKILVSLFLVFALFGGEVYSEEVQKQDLEMLKRVVEIGSLVNDSKYDKALAMCDQALKDYPDNPDLYYWKATIYINKKDNKSALQYIKKAMLASKDEPTYYVLRGSIYSDMGNHDLAMKDFDYAITLDPKNPVTYIVRAGEKISVGNYDGADADFKEAKKLQDEIQNKKEEPAGEAIKSKD